MQAPPLHHSEAWKQAHVIRSTRKSSQSIICIDHVFVSIFNRLIAFSLQVPQHHLELIVKTLEDSQSLPQPLFQLGLHRRALHLI
mmetsp:Transcript_33926/g.48184  ORF Transcript_33926/g.48184 Transcript_33926/m.48184 type:complete len:85 (-) Transcript_33926:495-749(-)